MNPNIERGVAPYHVQVISETLEERSQMKCSLDKGRLTKVKQENAQPSGLARSYPVVDCKSSATPRLGAATRAALLTQKMTGS